MRILGLCLSLLFASKVFATTPVILISDIDDTIELSYIRPFADDVANQAIHLWKETLGLFNSEDSIVGMAPLYQALAGRGDSIQYVSGTPQFLNRLPKEFLEDSGFPKGPLTVRPSLAESTEDYKVAKISAIVLAHPEARFILVGDNGERDVASYQRLVDDPRLRPQISLVCIHRLYPSGIGLALAPGQVGFWTAADLAIRLYLSGEIGAEPTLAIVQQVENGLSSEESSVQDRTFPRAHPLEPEELETLQQLSQRVKGTVLETPYLNILGTLSHRQGISKLTTL